MNELSLTLLEQLIPIGLHLLYALLILIVGTRLASFFTKRISKSKLLGRMDPSTANFISNFTSLALRIVVIVLAALVLGIPASAFITLFGSAGVAIGLALQGSLSNLAGGLLVMFLRPFSIGDYIRSESHEGTVIQISVFYTTIRTFDGQRIMLPNGNLMNNTLTNVSLESTRMLNIPFSVAYESDPAVVRRILLEQATAHPHVLPDPAPSAPMTKHADSALIFSLRCWTAKENYKSTEFDLLESVKVAFDREGISIPYPQIDVHTKP